MSIIFGIRKPTDNDVCQQELESIASATERYALSGLALAIKRNTGMGCQPCYTHDRSRLGVEPALDSFGNLAALDGRLDNYQQLCDQLHLSGNETTDLRIILEAYRKWGGECFSCFVGDWSIALWAEKEETLYLARDHAGTRTLYYELASGTTFWSTYLESFTPAASSRPISEEYAAAYLGSQLLRERTPYKGIRPIRPGHYVAIKGQTLVERRHWHWFHNPTTTYRTDRDYEEHFLVLFRQSVDRRALSDGLALAQLSGGMDSSSIVCMADKIFRTRKTCPQLLDTISYYDDSEPNWNEEPYFSTVEAARGKTGIHLRIVTAERSFKPQMLPSEPILPGMDAFALRRESSIEAAIGKGDYLCVLSGVGGDEVLGGVPTPYPELADHLMTGKLAHCLRRSVSWALVDRTPLHYMVTAILRYASQLYFPHAVDGNAVPPWIDIPHWKRHIQFQQASQGRIATHFERPVTIANEVMWWSLMETLPHLFPAFRTRRDFHYPFLDKQLVEFLFSIPREQLLQPGRRRHLMRRALRGIVPDPILERRRKAYLVRSPLTALRNGQAEIARLFDRPRIGQFEYVSIPRLKECMERVVSGRDLRWLHALSRTIAFELWLREREIFITSSPALDQREQPVSA